MPTLCTKASFAMVKPLLVEYYGNGGALPVDEPVPTVTTKDRFALMEPFLIGNHTKDKPQPTNNPLQTVTTKGWFGLIDGVAGNVKLDIRFRMLKPHELARAQGFPEDYKILGTIAEQTKQIGNAVPVNTAKALVLAAMGKDGG
jgi:DNA (cytosine-5)-methyltransferase 1